MCAKRTIDRLAPITLVYGKEGVGKSTFIKERLRLHCKPEQVSYLNVDKLSSESTLGTYRVSPGMMDFFRTWMSKLKLAKEVDARLLLGYHYITDMVLLSYRHNRHITFWEAGSSTQQVMSILAGFCEQARLPDKVLCIDRPCMFLSHETSYMLADIMLEMVTQYNPKMKIICEVSSDDLLRRFLRCIAEEKMSVDDLHVYCVNSSGGSKIPINEYGALTDNVGFNIFDEEHDEIIATIKAQVKRRKKEASR